MVSFGRSNELSSGAVAAIIVAVLVAVALALGLGLGLGLNNSSTSVQSQCYSVFQNQDQQNYDPSIPWDQSCPGETQCPAGVDPILILVSMDGFRPDYLDRGLTPTLQRMIDCGVTAPHMRSNYPTKTFPSHYTIATGLYAESHGIIGNSMYDVNLQEYFSVGSDNSYKNHWWGGEPIWMTAKNAGKKTVTVFWPGSETDGNMADHCYYYDESASFESRINEVMGYYSGDPSDYPSLVTLYFHEPDSAGHAAGPYSKQVDEQLAHVDNVISMLMSGLRQKSLENCANIMIVSDHGMDMNSCDRAVSLAPYFGDMLDDLYVYQRDHVRITSQYTGEGDDIVLQPDGASPAEILDKVSCSFYNDTKDWYVDFYRKEDLPKRMHYASNYRIEEIVADVNPQYIVFRDEESGCETVGGHGYDYVHESMHAIFIGYGPGFKSGTEAESFEAVELYNVMTDLLNIQAAPNNGTPGSLHYILSTSDPIPEPEEAVGEYSTCSYPSDIREVETRRNTTSTCNWQDVSNFTETPIVQLDARLNLTVSQTNAAIAYHLPLGTPELDFTGGGVCQLAQNDYVHGYSDAYMMPLWSAFTLQDKTSCSMVDPGCSRTRAARPDLIRPDVRLSPERQVECGLYSDPENTIRAEFLFPPGFTDETDPDAQFDGHIATNIVPMYQSFREGVWQVVLDLLEEYAEKYGDLQVVMGPLFDYNADGMRDPPGQITNLVGSGPVPLPSHYFVAASYCSLNGTAPLECADSTNVISMIIPHRRDFGNCWDQRYLDYIEKHVSRVRDVEMLSGLRMFPSVATQRRLLLAIRLEENLWERLSWTDLVTDSGDSCPPLTRPATCLHPGYDSTHPPVILISLDGFRPDYLSLNKGPILERLKRCGASSQYMRSIYPTFTFPNHYTITSGLYPETHGIVDNNMYDIELGQAFWLGSPNSFNGEWWIGDPIWNNVERSNKTAMTLMWPGSDVEIDGTRPSRYVVYNQAMPYHERVNMVLDWLENGADGRYPDFVTLYLSEVDHAGHDGGPASLMVEEAIVKVDNTLAQLMDGLYRLGLHQCVNIIVTSDHGMADMSCENSIILNDYIDMNALINKTYTYPGSAARMGNKYYRVGNDYFVLETGQRVPKEDIIAELMCEDVRMRVFDKKDLPRRHHYSNSDRIDDIVFIAQETWLVQTFSPWCPIVGQHGWDTNTQSMQAYFSAFGPGFLDKVEIEAFENIEVYNLMCSLLGIEAQPNNGTEGTLYHLMAEQPDLPPSAPSVQLDACLYPDNDDEYARRANLSTAQCSCVPPINETIREADERLNLADPRKVQLEALHIPHGTPYIYLDDTCLLHHEDYVSAYSKEYKMAAWTAFTLGSSMVDDPSANCLRPDVRLEQGDQLSCDQYERATQTGNVTAGLLFPPEFASEESRELDALLLTNSAPMYSGFVTGVWRELMALMAQWSASYNNVSIVIGPVFDFDADGRRDINITMLNDEVPLPSHYFAMGISCPDDCINMTYDVISFVVPHRPNIPNCLATSDYLRDNLARIRDVELLTDLEFLTSRKTLEGVRARTYIADTLW